MRMNSIYIGQPIENPLEIKEFYTFFEDVLPPHFRFIGESHDFYEAFVIYKGRARVVVNNDSFYISEGQMFVYAPGVFHSICNDDDEVCSLQIMSFSATAFPKTKGVYDLSRSELDEIKRISSSFRECLKLISLSDTSSVDFDKPDMKALIRGVEKQREIDSAILKKKIEIFLLEVIFKNETISSVESNASTDELSAVLGCLKDNLYGKITTVDVARSTLMSVPYIERLFHEYMGMGVMKYYNIMKMQEALNLLNKGHPIKDVSAMLGFANQNYFSTAFKKHFGSPPRNAMNKNTKTI